MAGEKNELSYLFDIKGGDFGNAGKISTKIKEILHEIGIAPQVIRRTAIVTYEAEMNVVMYAKKAEIRLRLTPASIRIQVKDVGPGIENIELAMQEGYSTATEEMREMGFGAGMGLPNIKKNADRFKISSVPGKGTSLDITLDLNQTQHR